MTFDKAELKAAAEWFNQAVAATNPGWVRDARAILRMRARDKTFEYMADALTRLTGTPYSKQTVHNRFSWALKVYRNHK